jgi:hypothetical protein
MRLTTSLPTNPHWARVLGRGPFSLCVIHKEGLCPSRGDINGLMMMTYLTLETYLLKRTWRKFMRPRRNIQSTAHQTIHFGLLIPDTGTTSV